jgi:hypothetical protein
MIHWILSKAVQCGIYPTEKRFDCLVTSIISQKIPISRFVELPSNKNIETRID